MFIVRFFTASPLGIAVGAITGIFTLIIIAAIVIFGLAIAGGPGACTPGSGEIVVSAANADSFDQKWDGLDAILGAGSPSSIDLNESEITSRADLFIEEESGDIGNVRVCVHDGFGEVTGDVGFAGVDVDFKVKGTVDLSGDKPVVQFDDIDIGNVPGFITGPFEGLAEDAIEELLEELDLDHTYTPILTEGVATIEGQP
jgi:hypothetical protein